MRNELNGQGAGGEHGMDTHAALMAQMGASKFCAILPGATQSSVQLTEAFITGAPCLQSQQDAIAWTSRMHTWEHTGLSWLSCLLSCHNLLGTLPVSLMKGCIA